MLEKRTYTIQELSSIIGTKWKTATDKKLKNYNISYTSQGRGNNLTYTITDIKDRFRVYCVFDLGFSPQTKFRKLRIKGCGMSRQTISKYIKRLEKLELFSYKRADIVYYRVYNYYGVQQHEIISREQYSAAWRIYWDKRKSGYDSRAAYSVMYNAFSGVPRKQRKLEGNGILRDTYNLLSELIAESYLLEEGG